MEASDWIESYRAFWELRLNALESFLETNRRNLKGTKCMANPDASREVVHIHRMLPATPDAVFLAWTNPDSLSRWISPYGSRP